MAMPIRVPPKHRTVKGFTKITLRQQKTSAAERYIQNHPELPSILAALREGMPVSQIAQFYATQGLLTISERVFAEYLYLYRNKNRQKVVEADGGNQEEDNINRIVPGFQPETDVDTEMDRAIRLQKIRIGLAVKQERTLGMPLMSTTKDMEVLGKFIELKAKRKGLLSVTNALKSGNQTTVSADVRDTLLGVRKAEASQDKLLEAITELASTRG